MSYSVKGGIAMIKQLIKNKKAEGYIDICVGVIVFVMILVIAVLLVKGRKLTALSEYERELIEKEKQKKTNNTTESPKHSDQE